MKTKEEVDKWLESELVKGSDYRNGFLREYKSLKATIIASLPGNYGFAMHQKTKAMYLDGKPVFRFTKPTT